MNDAQNGQPEITVLITAHNEARHIEGCLRAIQAQDYPMERVEILLVADRCGDRTVATAQGMGLERLRVLTIDQPPTVLSARQTALDLGLREARGEVVLVTNAAGRVSREWIRELTGHLGWRDGAATGPIIYAGRGGWLARWETLDALTWFSLQRFLYSRRISAILNGGNMAIRRDAYLETGGHPTLGFAPADDAALGQGLARAGWSLRFLTEPDVQDSASRSVQQFFGRLRRRHSHGCRRLHTLIWALVLINLILVLWTLAGSSLALALLVVRYVLGALVLGLSLDPYGQLKILPWIWLYEPIMTFLLPVIYLSKKIRPNWTLGGIQYGPTGPQGNSDSANPSA